MVGKFFTFAARIYKEEDKELFKAVQDEIEEEIGVRLPYPGMLIFLMKKYMNSRNA